MGRSPKVPIRIGNTYGELTVLKDLGTKSGHHYYKCRCENCEDEMKIIQSKLAKGNPTCRVCAMSNNYTDQVINGFKILHKTGEKTPARNHIWLCECTRCGITKHYPSNAIRRGAMSCACKKGDAVINNSAVEKLLASYVGLFADINEKLSAIRAENALLSSQYLSSLQDSLDALPEPV